MSSLLRPTASVLACLLGLLCLGAVPSPGNVALDYAVPPGCPAEAAFRQRVADLYDFDDPFVRAGKEAAFTVGIHIQRRGKRYEGVLRLTGGERGVRAATPEASESCDALVSALAHRVRMVILRPPQDDPPPPPPPQGDPRIDDMLRRLDRLEEKGEAKDETIKKLLKQVAKLEHHIKEEERKKKMDLTYSVFAGALMTANLTNDVGPGVWIGGDLRMDPISIGIELRSVLPARVAVGPNDLDLSHFVGLLTPCGRYWIFFGCAVAGAGVQIDHDPDFNPEIPPTGFLPLVQLGGRVGVEVPLGESRFALRGWGEVLYSTPSVSFSYGDGSSVDRPDVSAFFGLGFVAQFGNWEGAK